MKTLLYIFAVLFTTTVFGQTNLDTLIFNELNSYRVENNLKELVLDNSLYIPAEKHCHYMDSVGNANHDNLRFRYRIPCYEITSKTSGISSDINNSKRVITSYSARTKHNEIMLNTDYSRVCISSIVVISTEGIYSPTLKENVTLTIPVVYTTIVFF